MYRLHTPASEVAQALLIVMRRGSLRAAEEITGHKYETIGEWLRLASEHAEALTAILTQDLHLSTVEIDEFWSFVYKKTEPPTKLMPVNAGDASCKIAPAASLPPVPAVRIGDDLIERAISLAVARTQGRPLNWCSDGWRGYAAILTRAYRQPVRSGQRGRPPLVVPPDVRLTQAIKHRDEHGKLLSVEIRAALGEVITQPGTVHVERANGALRDRLNALTRKTHAFAKRDVTFDALIHLQLFEHNWIRPHHALRLPMPAESRRYQPRTPAMVLGLTNHLWSWIAFLTTSLYTTPK
ncbi:hypothetical protein KSD_41980 [Ktedonobacter sp. SOSP1-85]|uniref:hypothetical protein n=1 Tax=Ktedonobacter sp. SOSP1-85 TaxID=2778367 RepID=UPI001A1CD36A|nr:hypothetical protein [Ktedonobacter sp. SOSP1-85]GHO76427.1 hypothetical protein KSD_41980 [Ktedonobacter sp. SOSP1-85]